MNLFYAQVNKLLFVQLWPVVEASKEAMNILFWMKIGRATFYLLVYETIFILCYQTVHFLGAE